MTSILIEKTQLDIALSGVKNITPTRTTIPILGNILIEADNNILSVTSTDLDLMLVSSAPADTSEGKISTTVPAGQFCDAVSKLPKGCELSISTDETEYFLDMASGRTKTRLPTLPASDFPSISTLDDGVEFMLPATELIGLFSAVQHAISAAEDRPYLNGEFLHLVDKRLAIVATTGAELAFKVLDYLPEGAEEMPGVIIPGKSIKAMLSLLASTEQEILIRVSDAKVSIANSNFKFTSKLMDGEFPDYDRIIPKEQNCAFELYPQQAIAAIDQAKTVMEEANTAARFKFSNSEMIVDMRMNSGARAEGVADCHQIAGEVDAAVGVNPSYIINAMKSVRSGVVSVFFGGPGDPIKLTPNDDSSLTLVVVQRRLDAVYDR